MTTIARIARLKHDVSPPLAATYQAWLAEATPEVRAMLRVVPFAELKRRALGAPTGAMQPLHWVMGHPKTFTAERPLFGKHVGTYWWQPSLHGRDKSRFIAKSYEIVA